MVTAVVGDYRCNPGANAQARSGLGTRVVRPMDLPGLEIEAGAKRANIDRDWYLCDPAPKFHRLHLPSDG